MKEGGLLRPFMIRWDFFEKRAIRRWDLTELLW